VFYAPLLILYRITTLTCVSFDARALHLSKALPGALPPIPIGAGPTHKSLVSIVLDCDCP
jgi:predicted acylesterase/phospholipase RssA